ncbi:MAG TPA: tetratricopeptide repeat protein [Candidatus Solibacter sp.]|nr:tetratricopeptide repeat protein [Candidatus Solibacter sp.]
MAQLNEAEAQQSLAAARAAGNVEAQAGALFALAGLARGRGDRPAAIALYQQSGALWQQLHNERNLLATLNNLAPLLADVEQFENADNAARAATDIAQRLRDPGAMAMAVGTLGMVANSAGDHDTARTAYHKSLELAEAARDPVRIARAQYNIGWVAFVTGDFAEARRRGLAAAKALGPLTEARVEASIVMLNGRLDVRQHQYQRAMDRLGWAARTFHYAGDDEGAAQASFAYGVAEYLSGDRDGGRQRIESTFQGIRLNRNRRMTAMRLIGLSRLAAAAGATDDAIGFGQLALNIGTHLSDPALESMARQLLSGGTYAGAADSGIAAATVAMDVAQVHGETPEAPGAGDAADLSWLEHDLGVLPPAPPPSPPAGAPPDAEYVGPVRIIDGTADGHGYSILQDVAAQIGVATNHDAEAGLQAVLRRRDPLLLGRLGFDTEAGGLGIVSPNHDDIRAAATWLASMFKSTGGS